MVSAAQMTSSASTESLILRTDLKKIYLAFSSDVLSVGSMLDVSDPRLSSSNQFIFLYKRTFVPNSLQVTLDGRTTKV